MLRQSRIKTFQRFFLFHESEVMCCFLQCDAWKIWSSLITPQPYRQFRMLLLKASASMFMTVQVTSQLPFTRWYPSLLSGPLLDSRISLIRVLMFLKSLRMVGWHLSFRSVACAEVQSYCTSVDFRHITTLARSSIYNADLSFCLITNLSSISRHRFLTVTSVTSANSAISL